MENNSISVRVNYVNGTETTILDEEIPSKALEKYLFPDAGMPVTVSIRAKSDDGKEVSITVDKDTISVTID